MEEQSSDTRILDFLQQKHQSVKLTDILYFPGKTASFLILGQNIWARPGIVYPTKMDKSLTGLNW